MAQETKKLGRNDVCWCGSGRKYKHCHLKIDQSQLPEEKYAAAQLVYANNWLHTADHHHKSGVYHWMAECLLPYSPKRILDIGCGSGHGLLALFEILPYIDELVSIDENGACIDIAIATLRSADIDPNVVRRLKTHATEAGFVRLADEITQPLSGRCTLVESDILNDLSLQEALLQGEQVDAVTVWLTGTHMMRQYDANVMSMRIRSDGEHRLRVQNATYELANKILRVGGILRIVDRTEAPETDELRTDFMQAHREQASGTTLEVVDFQHHLSDEPTSTRTPMTVTPGRSGRIPVEFKAAVTSTISKKT